MTRHQAAAHVTRHRDPVDGLSALVVICAVGLALAPLLAALYSKLSSAEDPVSWRTGPRVGAEKPPKGVADKWGSPAAFDPAQVVQRRISTTQHLRHRADGTRPMPAGRSALS